MFYQASLTLLVLVSARAVVCDDTLQARADCSSGYSKCSPKGAATTPEPAVGSGLSGLYVDIVNSVKGSPNVARDLGLEVAELIEARAASGSLCCAQGTQCRLMQNLELPFCYDNYTTNYYLPGGAYGQIVSGAYTATNGATANLINGNYSNPDGSSGNIYGSPSSSLDTATLAIPTQYTAAGSGSAIAPTALGQEITYTTTVPGSTIPPSTVSAETISPSVVSGSTVNPGTTESPSTIPGTTVTPHVTTVVTRVAGTQATKTGDAGRIELAGKNLAVLVTVAWLAICA